MPLGGTVDKELWGVIAPAASIETEGSPSKEERAAGGAQPSRDETSILAGVKRSRRPKASFT